jgi:hypothetical protein
MGSTGLKLHREGEDFLSDSIDNRLMLHNLCASQKDKEYSLFLTLSCNQLLHPGISHIKRYIDNDKCGKNYSGFDELHYTQQNEVRHGFREGASTLLLRNWMDDKLRRWISIMRYMIHTGV